MARPKKARFGGGLAPEKDQSEVRWLISYSDFMMQLVCLFILLYSVYALDKGKMALAAASYRASMGLGEPPVHEAAGRGKFLAVGDRPLVGGRTGRADLPPGIPVRVDPVPGGWRVHGGSSLFAPGSAAFLPGVDRRIDSIAERFRAYAGSAFVTATAASGPVDATDGEPMKLAQARAEALAVRLSSVAGAFDPRFVQASGRVVPAAEAGRAEIYVRVK